jgi:hypothetical protein
MFHALDVSIVIYQLNIKLAFVDCWSLWYKSVEVFYKCRLSEWTIPAMLLSICMKCDYSVPRYFANWMCHCRNTFKYLLRSSWLILWLIMNWMMQVLDD